MPGCPACGTDVPAGASECPRCHLAVHLFDAVREAVGVPESDPSYTKELKALLAAVDPTAAEVDLPPEAPARIAFPARFPAPSPPQPPLPEGPLVPDLDLLPPLPALPDGGLPAMRRQLDDYLHLARRLRIDVSDTDARVHEVVAADDAATLEVLLRELFVRIAATLSESFEEVIGRRNGLTPIVPSEVADQRIGDARAALKRGDLPGAERSLREAREELLAREEEWATVQILLTECDLLAETVRELGGDPGPALGPLSEGRRLAESGHRSEAEPVLASAALALWAVLHPRFGPEMHRVKEALLAKRAAGGEVGPGLEHFRALTQQLGQRNFGAAVESYRALRTFVAGPSPPAAALAPAGRLPPAAVPGPTPK